MAFSLEPSLKVDWPVQWHDEIDSTNQAAFRSADMGEYGPLWIASKKQTSGRGQRGRKWSSESENLYATALFPFDESVDKLTKLSFCSCLAIIDAAAACGVDISDFRVKWPNDVRVKKRKLSGVLIETGKIHDDVNWVAVGIGVNVLNAPRVDQETCCLAEFLYPKCVSVETYLTELKQTFVKRVHSLLTNGFVHLREDWLALAEGLNTQTSMKVGNDLIQGIIRGIDDHGAILLETPDGKVKAFSSGEITVRH